MDDNTNDISDELVKKLLSTAAIGMLNDNSHNALNSIPENGCARTTVYERSPTSQITLRLLPDDIVKELYEAIALGGESVKKTLVVCYEDPNVLETMTSLVDMCVAYIGEEVTAILRKHSTI